MSETLQRKPTQHQSWPLTDIAKMMDAWSVLMADGWRGGVNPLGDSFRLEVHKGDSDIIADIGEWLVDDYGLRKITADERAANYDVVES
ncbi:hypothetical protein MHPYR_180045 [uncultured Mycobacterium sp.]|uniref:Uncharacterized protein n=1 Tax=uncultured Mycobacterium sp. TaxID=171292 RepID=A0A1Y5P4Z8_9MYCO|nr:hypothetical protein MHPYR_180045 [uncultured Mycobacterium sp.]